MPDAEAAVSRHTELAARCGRVADACVCVVLFAVPLWFGGRHDFGRFLYATTVAVATLAVVTRMLLRREHPAVRTRAYWILGAAVLLVGLQAAPLGADIVARISPGLLELIPAWDRSSDHAVRLGDWSRLSAAPGATRIGFAVLVSHALLFFVVVERLRSVADVRRIMQLVAASAAVMATLALLQRLTGSDELLWFYSHPWPVDGGHVRGTFTNRNHLAHFVVLGIGPLVSAWFASRSRARPTEPGTQDGGSDVLSAAWGVALLLAVATVALTLSKGAMVALACCGATAAGVLFYQRRLTSRHALGAGLLLGVAASFASLADYDQMLLARVGDLTSGSLERLDRGGSRRDLWAANLAAFQANPLVGYGVGSHPLVYPAFIETCWPVEFTHAESGYLHTLTETGVVGGTLMVGALLLVGVWCWRGIGRDPSIGSPIEWVGISAGLVASAAHSCVDFVWYVPACMSVAIVLGAAALRLHQFGCDTAPSSAGRHRVAARPLLFATGVGGVVAAALLWGPARGSFAWDRYLRLSVTERTLLADQPLSRTAEGAERVNETIAFYKSQMVDSLRTVLRHNPSHARAHQRLAGRLLQLFEIRQRGTANPLGLMHVRDAALASGFGSRDETAEWLGRAFGDAGAHLTEAHRHALAALEAGPLQGGAYGYLCDLSFLSAPRDRDVGALMDQALRLCPLQGGVLFEAGKQAWIEGDPERAIEMWKRAHQVPGSHQRRIVLQLAGHVPAETYLEEFEPDWRALSDLVDRYEELDRDADLRALADYARRLAAEPADGPDVATRSARGWLLASRIERQLGDFEASVVSAERALGVRPQDYAARWAAAAAYMKSERFDDATPHLRWCMSRKPDDRAVQIWLRAATKERLTREHRASLRR